MYMVLQLPACSSVNRHVWPSITQAYRSGLWQACQLQSADVRFGRC